MMHSSTIEMMTIYGKSKYHRLKYRTSFEISVLFQIDFPEGIEDF